MSSTSPVVLYHASCADGFGAAYAAWTVLGDAAAYLPVQYGQPVPLDRIPAGSDVYILDFSYDRQTLLSLAERQARVVIRDHHKTAREALQGLEGPGLDVLFDMEKSGVVLAWEHFHPGEPVPTLLRYVQDRDLWRWELDRSREVSAWLSTVDRVFGGWQWYVEEFEDPNYREMKIGLGDAILSAQRRHVESLASHAFTANVGGHRVPSVNSPIFQSEIGERLCELHPESPFAAVFFVTEDAEIWSLRSRNGFDVSTVAKSLGGGGHPAAAGFKRPRTS